MTAALFTKKQLLLAISDFEKKVIQPQIIRMAKTLNDDLRRELGMVPLSSAPAPSADETGVGEYCHPRDMPGPVWLLMFEDFARDYSRFTDEATAREHFAKSEALGWNCHLLTSVPRAPAPSAELKSERNAAQRAGVTTANYWMERAKMAEDQRERTRDVWATRAERAEAEIESLRAECGLRQIQGYKEGEEAASARLYEAEAEQLTRDMRQRAERAVRDLDKLRSDANKSNRILGERCEKLEAERDALRADADRYRWIRRSDTPSMEVIARKTDEYRVELYFGDELDAAIDAARAKVRT